MQDTYTLQLLKGRYYTLLAFIFKLIILLGCAVFIWEKIWSEQIQIRSVLSSIKSLDTYSLISLILVAFMVPVNWLVEAIKWKVLMQNIDPLTSTQSLRSVLMGLAFGFVTPRGIGDYVGRVLDLEPEHRLNAVLPTILSRVFQLLPTLIVGILGTWFFMDKLKIFSIGIWSFVLLIATLGMLMVLLFIRKRLTKYRIIGAYERVPFDAKIYLKVSGYSFLRYFIFSTQFLVIFFLLGVKAPLMVMLAGISWIFLVKSILPSFNFLSDLGVREFSAILFFQAYGVPLEPVLASSLLIWLLNILIPSVAGLIILGNTKLRLW